MSRSCTVYKITCSETNKIYVGMTTLSLYERLLLHWYCRNRVDYPLYQDMRIYARECFKIEKIETAYGSLPEIRAAKMEKYWIYILNTQAPNGYNFQKTARRNYMPYIEKRMSKNNIKPQRTNDTGGLANTRTGGNIRISTETFDLLKNFVSENDQYSIGGFAGLAIVEKIELEKNSK